LTHYKPRLLILLLLAKCSKLISLELDSKASTGVILCGHGRDTRLPRQIYLCSSCARRSSPSTGLYARQSSAEFEIVSCTATSVEVRGSQSTKLITGTILLYIQDGNGIKCSACGLLFRKITSVMTSGSGSKILTTAFATGGEILGPLAGSAIENDPLEPMAGCSHSSRSVNAPRSSANDPVLDIARSGECKASWLVKHPDGRCTHTNCFVETAGDPTMCFDCPMGECDNGWSCRCAGTQHRREFRYV
jgi:hypothetical protein